MPTINQLNQVDQVYSSDQIPLYSANNGDARKASVNQLTQYMMDNFGTVGFFAQVAVPSSSGFNIAMQNGADNVWLILQPLAPYAAGTVTLPLASSCVDGQEVIVCTTNDISSLTVNNNGAVFVFGAPTYLNQFGSFHLKYNKTQNIWYQISLGLDGGAFVTQTEAPNSSGFNVAVQSGVRNIWLNLNPVAAYDAGTITLPLASRCIDGQEVTVSTTNEIKVLTVANNGATYVFGEPAYLNQFGSFTLKYSKAQNIWIQTSLSLDNKQFLNQVAAPSASPFSISIANVTKSTWLIMQAASGLASGTIVLPAAGSIADQTEVLITSNNGVISLSASLNGAAAIYGWPGFIAPSGYIRAIFLTSANSWYVIGSTPLTNYSETVVTYTGDFTPGTLDKNIEISNAGGATIVTMPSAALYINRVFYIKTVQNQAVNSSASNIVPLVGGAAGTAIVSNTAGKWAYLVSNGASWTIMAAG